MLKAGMRTPHLADVVVTLVLASAPVTVTLGWDG